MESVKIFYKSDFKVKIVSEMGFATPFRLRFWTEKLSNSYEASWNGKEYMNCHPESETEMCIGFDDHRLGMGKLMVEATYYADDECFASGVCDSVVASTAVVCTDEQGQEYEVVLDREGDGGIDLIYSLPMMEAERKRVVAEVGREVAEAARVRNELERQENEQGRELAERNRQEAETERQEATEEAVDDAHAAADEARKAIADAGKAVAEEAARAMKKEEELENAIDGKVEKVDGMGLSSNDFGDAEKTKLEQIQEGAEKNVQADWNETDPAKDSYVKNKPTAMPASDVPAWAKQAMKPTYTASEVGALPSDAKIPSKTSELINDSQYVTKVVSDLTNYYRKSETYTMSEVDAMVSAIPKFKIEVVQELPTTDISTTTVYLLPNQDAKSPNMYTEYIYTNGKWEELGTQTVDLSDYYTKEETDDLLAGKADTDDIPTTLPASDVYAWAKQATKPTYTASEVGALPDTAKIPTKVSELTNDIEYVNQDAISDMLTKTEAGNTYLGKSENASSATKLANARTLWGQSFDGTADVSGAMSGASSIINGETYLRHASGGATVMSAKSGVYIRPKGDADYTGALNITDAETSAPNVKGTNSVYGRVFGSTLSNKEFLYQNTNENVVMYGNSILLRPNGTDTTKQTELQSNGNVDFNGNLSGVGSLSMNGVLSGARGDVKAVANLADYNNINHWGYLANWQLVGRRVTFVQSNGGCTPIQFLVQLSLNHKMLILADWQCDWSGGGWSAITSSSASDTIGNPRSEELTRFAYTYTVSKPSGLYGLNFEYINGSGNTGVIDNVMLFDLTAMFGSGNEPTTASEFANRLGYASIEDVPYIPFGQTELNNAMAIGGDLVVNGTPLKGDMVATKTQIEATSETTKVLEVGKVVNFGEVTTLNISLAEPTQTDVVNEYGFVFTAGVSNMTYTMPTSVKWEVGKGAPTITTGHTYEVSIIDGCATYLEFA